MNIATVMTVMGDQKYFDFASISIPSFLRNCPSSRLFVITDRLHEIRIYRGIRDFDVIEYKSLPAKLKGRLQKNIFPKVKDYCREYKRPGRIMRGNHYSMIVPVAQHVIGPLKAFTHILKVDIDSYFAGGDVIAHAAEVVGEQADVGYVLRKHPEMVCLKGERPGSGFMLWKKTSTFAELYDTHFLGHDQGTFQKLVRDANSLGLKVKAIEHPGCHFVYPFFCNPDFSKADAERFLPAYFHLTDPDLYEHQLKMDRWFNA